MTSITQKISKVLLILFLLQIIFAIVNVSHAHENNVINLGNILDLGDDFYNKGKNSAASGSVHTTQEGGATITIATPTDTDLKSIISDIYNILFPIGVVATVIIGGVLGIKFMLASAEDKAKIKESFVPYVAGCIIIYGAFGIWKIAITVFSAIG